MTSVKFTYCERGLSLVIKGHSEREADGTAYLCSKITVLGQTLEEACERFAKDRDVKITVKTGDGYRKVEAEWRDLWQDEKERLMEIYETIRAGFEILEDQFSGKIVFAYENLLEK